MTRRKTDSAEPAYDLTGKTAVVTGATTGIGHGIAVGLAKAGATVVVDHLDDPKGANATVVEIAEMGGRAVAVQADVSQPDQVRRLFAESSAAAGGIDILVNNASLEVNRFVWEMEDDDWRRVLASSLDAVFYCSKYVLPYMVPRGSGKIVNISSIHDTVPRKGAAPYCVAKAGLLMLTQVLALELAPHNIQVNAVSPGVVLTERTDEGFDRAGTPRVEGMPVLQHVPSKRPGSVEEIVEPVMYLCSSRSGYTSGTTVYVDAAYRLNVCPIPDGDARPFLERLKDMES